MGASVSPAQAKQWLTATRGTLSDLLKIHPLMLSASELPVSSLKVTTRNRVLGRLVEKGYIVRIGQPPHSKYTARPEAIEQALADDALISEVLWPTKLPNLSQLDLKQPSPAEPTEPAEPAEPELAPPPSIDNMRRPPPGASPEVVQEWIFTMLHAQTENLIYIREQVDSLLNEWRR